MERIRRSFRDIDLTVIYIRKTRRILVISTSDDHAEAFFSKRNVSITKTLRIKQDRHFNMCVTSQILLLRTRARARTRTIRIQRDMIDYITALHL